MIAQVVKVVKHVYDPVHDISVEHVIWTVEICSDNYNQVYETNQLVDRYGAEKLCTILNHSLHPEWFEH